MFKSTVDKPEPGAPLQMKILDTPLINVNT